MNSKYRKYRSAAAEPTGGAYSAPPDPTAGGEEASCPSPETLSLLSALQHSIIGTLGLKQQKTVLTPLALFCTL